MRDIDKVYYKVLCKTGINELSSLFADGVYKKTYKVGKITRAHPDTLGIMVFSSYDHALEFVLECDIMSGYYTVYKAKGIGEPKYPKCISKQFSSTAITDFYGGGSHLKMTPPAGTVCFDAIRLL